MATPIPQAKRYFAPGITKVVFAPTIANPAAPTRAEIAAGDGLEPEVGAVDGWQVTSDTADTPDLASRFVGKIPTTTSADDSSLNFYLSSDQQDVRSILPRGTTGYILWMDEGDDPSLTMDVFPIMVSSAPKQRSLTDPAAIQINFTITREPQENVPIPPLS